MSDPGEFYNYDEYSTHRHDIDGYRNTSLFGRCPARTYLVISHQGGGPRVVVSTAAFHARVRGSVPGLGGLKETKNVYV